MNVNINVKGVSNKASKIRKITWTYPDGEYSLRSFIEQTARMSAAEYLAKPDGEAVAQILSPELIEGNAKSGKIAFGRRYGEKKPDPAKAAETAVQAFEDGLVAIFIGEERFEDLDAVLPLTDGCEVSFIKLTFLAGRMW